MKTIIMLSRPREGAVYCMNPYEGVGRITVGLVSGSKRAGTYREYDIDTHVIPVLSKYFRGATITPSRGLWKGKAEPSVVVSVVPYIRGTREAVRRKNWRRFEKRIDQLADALGRKLRQQSVMVDFILPDYMRVAFR